MTQKKRTILAVVLVVIAIIVCYMFIRWKQNHAYNCYELGQYTFIVPSKWKETEDDSIWALDDNNYLKINIHDSRMTLEAATLSFVDWTKRINEDYEVSYEIDESKNPNQRTSTITVINHDDNTILYSCIVGTPQDRLVIHCESEMDKAEQNLEVVKKIIESVNCQSLGEFTYNTVYDDEDIHIEALDGYYVDKKDNDDIEILQTLVDDYKKCAAIKISKTNNDKAIRIQAEETAKERDTTVENVVLPNGCEAYAVKTYNKDKFNYNNVEYYYFLIKDKTYYIRLSCPDQDGEEYQQLWKMVENFEIKG